MCILGVNLGTTIGKYDLSYGLEIGALPARVSSMSKPAHGGKLRWNRVRAQASVTVSGTLPPQACYGIRLVVSKMIILLWHSYVR